MLKTIPIQVKSIDVEVEEGHVPHVALSQVGNRTLAEVTLWKDADAAYQAQNKGLRVMADWSDKDAGAPTA